MLEECEKQAKPGGEIDGSRFGAKRVRGKRSLGAGESTRIRAFKASDPARLAPSVPGEKPVFGLLKRNGKIYTQIVKNCSVNELLPILSIMAPSLSAKPVCCKVSYCRF